MAVVPLERAAAAEIAAELSLVLRAARIVADQRTNSLVVTAETEAELSRVLGLVEALDVESTGPHP